MKFLKSSLIFLIIITTGIIAQDKELTLDLVINKGHTLYPENMQQLNWIPGTSSYSYIDEINDEKVLVSVNAEDGESLSLLTMSNLNEAFKNSDLDSIKRFPRIEWLDNTSFRFTHGNKILKYNLESDEVETLNTYDENGKNLDYNSDNVAAYTIDNNLYISKDGEQIQITNDEDEEIVNGQTVHRVEFGINTGTFWSPDNNYLAFYRKDETMVTDYPTVDVSKRPAELKNIKYPMAGMESHNVTLGVYDLETGETTFMNTGEPKDQFLTAVTWDPNEKYIYIGLLNRDQNHLKLNKYDIKTGEFVSTLFEEKDDKYVEPEHGLIFLPNDETKFLWFSEKDEWNHLYLYNTEGEMLNQITKGDWEVLSFNGFDESGENFFITSTKDSPIERHQYKVNIDSRELTKITQEAGTHSAEQNYNGKFYLDSYSSTDVPRKVVLLDENGNELREIFSSENPLNDYENNIGEIKISTIKSADDEYDLFYRMILPPDFDESKKYPVMVYVYGGPHVQLVRNTWLGASSTWFLLMAQKGYIVFTVDNRGSANRGLEFEQETFRHLGTEEIEDQSTGVEFLTSLPYVDADRIGVFGWSYGGFMTTSLMTRKPELFKVGVGGGAVIDWSYYEVMYTERYMDTPETNPEGYKEANLLNFVHQLKGKLLLVHGTEDPTVVWQHTLLFAEKAAHLGIPLNYYPYVGHGHGVGGQDRFHLYQKITNYFDDNL